MLLYLYTLFCVIYIFSCWSLSCCVLHKSPTLRVWVLIWWCKVFERGQLVSPKGVNSYLNKISYPIGLSNQQDSQQLRSLYCWFRIIEFFTTQASSKINTWWYINNCFNNGFLVNNNRYSSFFFYLVAVVAAANVV